MQRNATNFLMLALTLFSCSAIWLWRADVEWHDQQRLAQLALLIPCILSLLLIDEVHLSSRNIGVLGITLVAGFTSSVLAPYSHWALLETARYAGLLALMQACAQLKTIRLSRLFPLVLLGISGIQAFQFITFYAMAFITGIRDLDTRVLVTGFSNPRFFGQFQALALPIVAMLGISARESRHFPASLLILVILSLQWCIAIALGGRGLFLAAFCSNLILMVCARQHWRLIIWQAASLIIGLILYVTAFHLVPIWQDIPESPLRLIRDGLSAREIIWKLALHMTLENPWLGVGPMHFAANVNHVAAHPHQMVLQWTAEWGVPATLLALWIISIGMLRGLRVVATFQSQPLDAALWTSLMSALILAQVDGVLVMPYTEVWLAALAGLAMARWSTARSINAGERFAVASTMLGAALVLASVLYQELPVFLDRQAELADQHVGWKPRFWINGWIGEDADSGSD